MSKFICKLWDLQHKMWMHRNSFVHSDSKSIHQHEEEVINRCIREEFIIGPNGLDINYAGLFKGNVQLLLKSNEKTKMLWLYRIWAGRDRLRKSQDLSPWHKDPLAASFIERNRLRKKRKRGIG